MDERLTPPAGIQLSLDSVRDSDGSGTYQAIDNGAISHFTDLVLWVLNRLSAADQRRVLRQAYRDLRHR